MKFDNVMVAVDGSTFSDVAIDLALHSASMFATRLSFVNVVDTGTHEFSKTARMTRIASLRVEGEAIVKKAQELAAEAGVDCEGKVLEGVPWQVLSELTKEYDMMIMSITGSGSFGLGKLGTTTIKVIENSHCPVLTLKSGSHRVENVLLPVNSENLPAIDLAIETVKRISGKLTILCVKSPEIDAEGLVAGVSKKCEEAGIPFDTQIATGDPAHIITAESGKYDLVVMGTEGRSGLMKAMKGSTAEKVLLHASCPVTIVKNS